MNPSSSRSQSGNYTKFKGTRSGLLTAYSIHYNESQLLLTSTGLTREIYKKVSFKDICGFSRCESSRRETIGAITGIIAGIFFLILLAQRFEVPALWVATLFFLALFIMNLAKGPGCKCVLSTAYSSIPLKGITRMKRGIKFQEILEQNISSVQGLIEPEDIDRLNQERDERSESPPPQGEQPVEHPFPTETERHQQEESTLEPKLKETPQPPPILSPLAKDISPPPLPKGDGVRKTHYILPIAALLLAISSLLNAFIPDYPIALTCLFYATALIGAAFSLSRRVERIGGSQIHKTSMTAVVYFIVGIVVAYFTWIGTFATGSAAHTSNPYDPLEMVDTTHPAFVVLFLINGIACIGFALFSYLGINKSR